MKVFISLLVFSFFLFGSLFEYSSSSNLFAEEFVGGVKADDYDEPVVDEKPSSQTDGYGPKIKGVQLGMTKDTALNILKSQGYEITTSSGFSTTLHKDGLFKTIVIIVNKQDIVDTMYFSKFDFNADTINDVFIKKFCENYKIPIKNLTEDFYNKTSIIEDREVGYKVTFKNDISITAIKKSSDLKFD